MNDFDEIVFREKETRLNINRVPPRVKNEFIEFADEEFCSDYGACLHSVWDSFKLWKVYFEHLDMKMNIIIDKLETPKEEQHEQTSTNINLLSGKKIKKEVG